MINQTIPTHLIVQKQLPAFVVDNHPTFVRFLENYYEFLDQDKQVNDYIRNVLPYLDIDRTTQEFLESFFEELREMPSEMVADKRLLAKHIYDLYDTKGSIESFELLFRILFDEDIEILFPSEQILKASDGVWVQDVFITIQTISGDLPTDGTLPKIVWENKFGKFSIRPTKIVVDNMLPMNVGVDTYRVFFSGSTRLSIEDDQVIYGFDDDTRTFVGRLIKSPASIKVLDSGQYWQIGTVFVFPGSRGDSICRVTSVGTSGTVEKLEIIQNGFGHTVNQNITISPFPAKPAGTAISVERTIVGFSGGVPHYQISMSISDNMDGLGDSVIGYTDADYVDDYVDDYLGNVSLSTASTPIYVPSTPNVDDITIQQWIASRATFVYEFANVVRTRGTFESERGMLSNPAIRLQDSFYYQTFSYVIKTKQSVDKYAKVLKLIHPAGMKFFAELQKEFVAESTSSASSSVDVVWNNIISIDNLPLNIDGLPITIN